MNSDRKLTQDEIEEIENIKNMSTEGKIKELEKIKEVCEEILSNSIGELDQYILADYVKILEKLNEEIKSYKKEIPKDLVKKYQTMLKDLKKLEKKNLRQIEIDARKYDKLMEKSAKNAKTYEKLIKKTAKSTQKIKENLDKNNKK